MHKIEIYIPCGNWHASVIGRTLVEALNIADKCYPTNFYIHKIVPKKEKVDALNRQARSRKSY